MTPAMQAMQACRYLAGVCDGAKTKDCHGFNGADSRKGKRLAAKSMTVGWTKKEMVAAVAMMQKYRRQLQDANLGLPEMKEISR